MSFLFRILMVGVLIQVILTCANTDDGEYYPSIYDTGLILTESNHIGGYGRSDCFFCKNINKIHVTDNSGGSVDVAAIREQTIQEGVSSCIECHGGNGVETP